MRRRAAHDPNRPDEALRADIPPPVGTSALGRQLLAVQQLAGNRAVGAALASAAGGHGLLGPPIALQRDACCSGCAGGGECRSEEPAPGVDPVPAVQRAAPGVPDGSTVVLATIPIGTAAGASAMAHATGADGPAPGSTVQRAGEPADAGGADAAGVEQSWLNDRSSSASAGTVDDATARAMVADAVGQMTGTGAVVKPFPDDLVATNGEAGGGVGGSVQALTAAGAPLQRAPDVQRSAGGGGWHPEGGVIGSLQVCYDLCKAEVSLLGWVWAGGGVAGKGLLGGDSFYGAFVFAEKHWGPWPLASGPNLECGTCRPRCARPDHESFDWGGGIAGFPIAIKPKQRVNAKFAGVEIGALLTPHASLCDANLEFIILVDITQFLGPVGLAVKRGEAWINAWAPKLGVKVDCGIGLDVSGTIHLCHSVPGSGVLGVTSDSATICGGGYIGCNINLPHDKNALPH